MRHFLFIFSFLVFVCSALSGFAQDRQKADTSSKGGFKKHKNYVIVMNDGTEYIGEILEDNGREMLINVPNKGKIYIPKYVVKSVDLVTETNFQNNEYLSQNHFPRYYMMGTNALPFKKREFSTNMYYFLAGSASYNVNERVSLGVVTTFWGSPIALSAKTSFMISEKNYVGVDAHAGTIIYSAPGTYFGHLGGKFTHGDANSNFSVSGGLISYNYNRTTYSGNGKPVSSNNSYVAYYLGAAGASRISKSNMFVGEFMVFPNNNFGIAALGIRSILKEKSSFVFGFCNIFRLSPPNGPAYYYGNNHWLTTSGFYYSNYRYPVIPIPYLGISFKI